MPTQHGSCSSNQHFHPSSTALDSQVSSLQIEQLVEKMVRWEDFAPFFELSEAEQEEICRNNERNYRAQKRDALNAWRDKCGRAATYRSFLDEVARVNKHSLAETESTGTLASFRRYLVECYAVSSHPSQVSWPFSHDAAYVDLPLFEASIAKGKPENEPGSQPQKMIKLNEIFLADSHQAKRKVVLLEGVAGCGKTTLTWHAYQKWAEGKLFQMFPLLIHVPLEDPVIRSATCLADIIPHSSKEMREAVAKEITGQHGKGVCFLLDGWDELPPDVRRRGSFLYKLIAATHTREMLSHCSFIVTSRPAASGSLYQLLTSRIVVGRLDRRRVDDLVNEYLPPEETEELLKILEQRPQLAKLCNLPINATIVIHLFRQGVRSFPETRTGLFKALLCNLLIRHIQLRTEEDDMELGEQFEFEEMPGDLPGKFDTMCCLAFQGVMEDTKVFKMAALKCLGLSYPSDTFSLMEIHLTVFGRTHNITFLHHSVQEFLAAWHMSRLDSERQAKAVSNILHSSPLSPILPFLAGLTGLTDPAVRGVLLEITEHHLDIFAVLANRPQTEAADRRRLALALLNCIYETQSSSLCEQVVCHGSFPDDPYSAHISFQYLSLDATDCLSIGYFLANHTSCCLDLHHCFIGDAGYEAMMMQLSQSADTRALSSSNRSLDLAGNPIISGHCLKMVGDVLQTHLLNKITFRLCWLPTQVGRNLTYLIEGLCRRPTPISVSLTEAITSAHSHYLVLLITTCPLRHLGLIKTNVGGCCASLAEAVKQTTAMEELRLGECNIGDRGLMDLGRKARNSVRELDISRNPITSSAVKRFLQYHYFSRLQELDIGRPLNHEERVVYKRLRLYRYQCKLPQLTIFDVAMRAYSAGEALKQTYVTLPKAVRERNKE